MVHQGLAASQDRLVHEDQRENLALRTGIRAKLRQTVLVVMQAVSAVAQTNGGQTSTQDLHRRPDRRILLRKAATATLPRRRLTTPDRRHFHPSKTINHNRKKRKLRVPPSNRAVLHSLLAFKSLPHFRFFGNREYVMNI